MWLLYWSYFICCNNKLKLHDCSEVTESVRPKRSILCWCPSVSIFFLICFKCHSALKVYVWLYVWLFVFSLTISIKHLLCNPKSIYQYIRIHLYKINFFFIVLIWGIQIQSFTFCSFKISALYNIWFIRGNLHPASELVIKAHKYSHPLSSFLKHKTAVC